MQTNFIDRREMLRDAIRQGLACLMGLGLAAGMVKQGFATTIAELKDQLRFDLQARLPEEFAFLDRVVLMVNQGQLSQTLVQSTFQWARKKRPYPFQFFKRGLILRAAQQGLVIDP